jgi:hypothetical protein
MRIVLADVKGGDGFVSKDTVAGGYGSRLRPFSKVTTVISQTKRRFHDLPSVHLAYAAALATRAGHTVVPSSGEIVDGDVAIVLSSLVDYRRETAWADAMRARGTRVGFIGLAAARMPELFEPSADFILQGEPEAALFRLMDGETLSGLVPSPDITDLDVLPFPDARPAARCRCSRAAAVRSSARTARTGSCRHIARARSATSSTSSRISRTSAAASTSSFAIRCSRRNAIVCSRCATAFSAASCRTRSSARRASTGWTRSC